MSFILSDVAGWAGTALYIIAYILLSLKKITAENSFYHLLNILGAAGLIINAMHWGDYPNLVVNLVWLAIGTVAIVMIIRKRHVHSDEAV